MCKLNWNDLNPGDLVLVKTTTRLRPTISKESDRQNRYDLVERGSPSINDVVRPRTNCIVIAKLYGPGHGRYDEMVVYVLTPRIIGWIYGDWIDNDWIYNDWITVA